MSITRRDLLQASGVAAVSSAVLSRRAFAGSAPESVLDGAQRATLDLIGDALVPGAAAAGFSRYIESQLSASAEDALLMLRYLGVPPPYRDFYVPALAAIDRWSLKTHGVASASLTPQQAASVVADIASGKTGEWNAPPGPFVYFVLRADAIDVVYGTRAGFARLGVPYAAHIEPTRDW